MEKPNKKASEIVFHEIGVLTNKTIEYNHRIKASKTRTKVDYYYKKMVKNNKRIELLLGFAQQLEQKEKDAQKPKAEEAVATA
jgi:hypothetical protein